MTPKVLFRLFLLVCARTNNSIVNSRICGVNQRGLSTTAASGGRRECESGSKKENCERERSNATILLTGPLVRVQLGEPKQKRVQKHPFCFTFCVVYKPTIWIDNIL